MALGNEVRVNTAASSTQEFSQITALSNGGYVIVWQDVSGSDGASHVAVLELQLSATENSSLHLGATDGPVLSLLPLPYALRDDI